MENGASAPICQSQAEKTIAQLQLVAQQHALIGALRAMKEEQRHTLLDTAGTSAGVSPQGHFQTAGQVAPPPLHVCTPAFNGSPAVPAPGKAAEMVDGMKLPGTIFPGRMHGHVKSYNDNIGIGFIHCRETMLLFNHDVLINRREIRSANAQVGSQVCFFVEISNKGLPQARQVELRLEEWTISQAQSAIVKHGVISKAAITSSVGLPVQAMPPSQAVPAFPPIHDHASPQKLIETSAPIVAPQQMAASQQSISNSVPAGISAGYGAYGTTAAAANTSAVPGVFDVESMQSAIVQGSVDSYYTHQAQFAQHAIAQQAAAQHAAVQQASAQQAAAQQAGTQQAAAQRIAVQQATAEQVAAQQATAHNTVVQQAAALQPLEYAAALGISDVQAALQSYPGEAVGDTSGDGGTFRHHDPSRRYIGMVKHFRDEEGFGFIECPETAKIYSRDVFLHRSQVGHEHDLHRKKTNKPVISVGDTVSFIVSVEMGMPKAKNVEQLKMVAGEGEEVEPSKRRRVF